MLSCLKACFVFVVCNAQKFIISLGVSLQFEVYAVSTFSLKMFWGFFVGFKFAEQLNLVLSHLRSKYVTFGIHIGSCKEIFSFCKEASLLLLAQQIFYHVAFPLFFVCGIKYCNHVFIMIFCLLYSICVDLYTRKVKADRPILE